MNFRTLIEVAIIVIVIVVLAFAFIRVRRAPNKKAQRKGDSPPAG